MAQIAHPHHPDIAENMWHQIDGLIETYQGVAGSLITTLRECQEIVGYLPTILLDYISRGLNLPASSVFGVATFYSFFSLTPKGKHTIKVCMGTACYVKGIKEVLNRISNEYHLPEGGTTEDRRFSLEAIRCLGACGLAPVVGLYSSLHIGGDSGVQGVIGAAKNVDVPGLHSTSLDRRYRDGGR